MAELALDIEAIKDCIQRRDWRSLKSILQYVPHVEISDILSNLPNEQQVLVFRALDRETSANVFSFMESDEQDALLELLSSVESRDLLANLSPDDRTELLLELPSGVTRRLMELLSEEDLRETRQLLGYPEESVGRIMTPDYVRVRGHWTVDKALDHIRRFGKDSETINIVYVVDKNGVLIDSVRLRKIIMAVSGTTIEEIRPHINISLSAYSDQEEAVRQMQKYDVVALPVVDSKSELLGIVTVDDVLDIAEEEATEDMHIAASVTPLKEAYHNVGVFSLFQKRVVWLVVLVILNILSSSVIANFNDFLGQVAILMAFVPMLIGTGGNTGAQASTLVIRALVTGDITVNQVFSTALKEFGVSILLGTALGLVAGCIGFVNSTAVGLTEGVYRIDIFAVVAISMLAIVMTGNMIGMMLPFILSKLKIDPAIASGPLITTLTDTIGLLIYFKISTMIINV